MDSTFQSILIIAAIAGVGVAYIIAGIVASDRFCRYSRQIDNLLTTNEFCFAITVFFWPIIGIAGALYFRASNYQRAKK